MSTGLPRVLLVEDDEALRSALARLLTENGYEVGEAPNGRVALEQMAQQPAQRVITDMIMPEMEEWRRFWPFAASFPQ
jgi:CheY-like chemotaxis protein